MRPLLLSVLLSLVTGSASASSDYPSSLQSALGLSAGPPPCTLCHRTNSGGSGTAGTPFATAMRNAGLTGGGDTASLIRALDTLTAASTDSDGDGVPDVSELRAGTDPNASLAPQLTPTVPPRYGCGASAVPETLVLGALIAALAPVWRRRRR